MQLSLDEDAAQIEKHTRQQQEIASSISDRLKAIG